MWSAGGAKNKDSESEEESEEEESSEDEAGPSSGKAPKAELTREELKAQKKAKKEAAIARAKAAAVQVGDLPPSDSEEESEDDKDAPMLANPNHSKAARNQTKKPVAKAEESDDEAAAGVKKLSIADSAPGNRKEREAAAAAAAKERYQKLHEAGKTDQAKADLARLRLIREKREQEAARKQVCWHILLLLLHSYMRRDMMLTDFGFDRPRRKSAKPRRSSRGNSSRLRRLRGARPPLVLRRKPRAARNKGNEGGGVLNPLFFMVSSSLSIDRSERAAVIYWVLLVPFIRPAPYTCICIMICMFLVKYVLVPVYSAGDVYAVAFSPPLFPVFVSVIITQLKDPTQQPPSRTHQSPLRSP